MKNKMKSKILQRKNRGITLIALVITIIILLILAGISIAMLTGDNGLLQKATDAKTKSDESQIRERIQLAYHSAITEDLTNENGELTIETLQDILDKEFAGKEVTINTNIEEKQWEIRVDNIREYVKAGKEPTQTVKNTLQVGDYVKYNGEGSCSVLLDDMGVKSSYASRTGYTWDHRGYVTFLPETVAWRVWEKKQDGTVTIVPEKPVNKLWLSGKNGFVNYIEILERICDIYTNESLNVKNDDVRSLKFEDIATDRVSDLKEVEDNKLSEFENNYGEYYENNPYKRGTFYMEADGLTLNKDGYQASDSSPVRIRNTSVNYANFQFKNIRK